MSAPLLSALPVDHVAFASRDLDAAQDHLAARGLSHTRVAEARWPSPEGPHRARTLSVMLPDGYLDVIELPSAPALFAATGVVLGADDLTEARARLLAAGVRCGKPYTIARRFDGAGPDQRYEIFGIDAQHPCGLPQAVIATRPGAPMENRSPHVAKLASLADAARLLGIHLDSSG
jgi:hypothetical protein